MNNHYADADKFGDEAASPLVEAFHSAVRDRVRQALAASGGDWNAFVFDKSLDLITADDFAAIDARILALGHRYEWSALVSVKERPEAYKPAAGLAGDLAAFSFEHPGAVTAPASADGWAQCGIGDNVVPWDEDLVGTARYVRSSEQVLEYLNAGVPAGTIAVIDDSGGTLTAPILEQFTGVLCAGGTVRSHLGILTREYNIPCFMNAKLSGIREGDTVKMEVTARAKTADAYQHGIEMTAKVWRKVEA
ncbi:MAG: PEP-utilizing enzyme [Gammaproteobacteria bacterium]